MTTELAARPSIGDGAFLAGRRVALRPLLESDVDGPYVKWFNDEEVCRYNSHHVRPYLKEQALEYVRAVSNSTTDLVLAIVIKETGAHIGNVSLQGIDLTSRSAEFAIVIGDKNAWGHGYSKEAAALICRHGFMMMNLHRIGCGTAADNLPMIKLAKWLGMTEEGRRREAQFKNGRYVDIAEFGMLVADFTRMNLTE